MGQKWDGGDIAFNIELWQACLRVLKPGGHLLAFGGTRTYHRMAVAIEDAGFEIRDSIHWVYGSGFPKSLNLKDEHAGWGTALKPAHEPIVLARKPLAGTVAANVLEHGTGALNIDGCRVGEFVNTTPSGIDRYNQNYVNDGSERATIEGTTSGATGRWPANIIFDKAAGAELDEQSGIEASRFFYCPKPGKKERNAGGANAHPTVKPVELMRYLCRLVTPPNGTVLDPFLGSGTTAVAAILEGFAWVGCEMTADYLPIIKGRVQWAQNQQPKLI
jgi:site-specific DNA-methyltransferase (adenine-specific)